MTRLSEEGKHFYGRKKGRPLHGGRAQAMLADFMLEIQQPLQPHELFTNKAALWVEVGFGNGEHLVGQAANNPHVNILGCEPFINGAAAAANDAGKKELNNLRIWPDDALPLLSSWPYACIDRFFLLFSDPWPKMRHHKRRFIQPETLELLARLLKPGAQLRLATDDLGLAQWMLLQTAQSPHFQWLNFANGDWHTQPHDWVETRYQQKAAQQGRRSQFMDFVRL